MMASMMEANFDPIVFHVAVTKRMFLSKRVVQLGECDIEFVRLRSA